MYLTRFTINPARRGAQKLLGSPQAMHAAVLASFLPQSIAHAGGPRVLWRVDRRDRTDLQLFIASPGRPDLTHLVEQAGWPTTETWNSRSYTPLLERLTTGQRWAFRLKANPVHHVRLRDGERTRPLGHVTVDQQRTWLLDRSAKHGFAVTNTSRGDQDLIVHDREILRFRRHGQTVTLATASFSGTLEITDPEALRTALTHGIGRAKGYGCGMLTIAPTC